MKTNRRILCVAAGAGFALCAAAAPPAWWTTRGVLATNAANDYAPATAGQLKHIASMAKSELDDRLSGGAGTGVAARVSSFQNSNNYVALNLGQVKFVAQPFYDRLITAGLVTGYPWTVTVTDDMDFAAANLGQVKNVFSFNSVSDADNDGLPDSWEMAHFGSLAYGYADDPDADGLTNAEEYQYQTDPDDADSDNDGTPDGEEFAIQRHEVRIVSPANGSHFP